MEKFIIGVDLGGTLIRAARLDQKLNILERVETLTLADEGGDAVIERIKVEVAKVMPEDQTSVLGIGISSPGPLDPETGTVINPPNLPGWEWVPLGSSLKERFGLPVYVGNDANVAALAETVRGAARGYQHVIYLTISTGIGSGIIIDGRLLLGRQGFAAETGCMIVDMPDGPVTLETLASGTGIAQGVRDRLKLGDESNIPEMVGGNLDLVDGKIVGMAANAGDTLALEVIAEAGRLIGLGITSLLHLFDPEIIVIGGGASVLGDLLFNSMHETIQKNVITKEYVDGLVFTAPDLGGDVSIYGAAALVVTQGGVMNISDVVAKLG
jgi:glucokinase